MRLMPVTLPPGRAKLATSPPKGSPAAVMTIGMVEVARLAASGPSVPSATMTSTLRRTSSAASCRPRRGRARKGWRPPICQSWWHRRCRSSPPRRPVSRRVASDSHYSLSLGIIFLDSTKRIFPDLGVPYDWFRLLALLFSLRTERFR
jgi:hypothetical protein